jgi:hypothetical protein
VRVVFPREPERFFVRGPKKIGEAGRRAVAG